MDRSRTPVPLLFLVADTGGGHRSAARAIGEELGRLYPGRFVPVLCDPLGGPGSARPLRWICGLYGPSVRLAPWLWGAAWHCTNSPVAMRLLAGSLLRPASSRIAEAVRRHRPAAIVSLHPFTGTAAVLARRRLATATPVATVVTDLITPHASWHCGPADLLFLPTAEAGRRWRSPASALVQAGLPVAAAFRQGPAGARERTALRRSLGVPGGRFLVLLTGGGEGCGGLARSARALLRRFDDVQVVAICGRNRQLRRSLDRLAERCGGRLTVRGFVGDMAAWLRCADVMAGKAGPGMIAEATCCGVPLLLTSQLPGQERGNAAFVVSAGAGSYVPGTRRLVAEVGRLRGDPGALAAMRTASARLGRPAAATMIATQLAELAEPARLAGFATRGGQAPMSPGSTSLPTRPAGPPVPAGAPGASHA